ncbi:hypothetical protein D3C84_658390 [compost metagenome]
MGGARPDIGVHRGGGEALVFTHYVDHFAGAADEGVGHDLQNDFLGALFMLAVEEGVKEADDHRLYATGFQRFGRLAHLLLIQGCFDLAVWRQDALIDRDTVASFDQWVRLPGHVEMQGEIIRSLVPPDMKDIAEALGR